MLPVVLFVNAHHMYDPYYLGATSAHALLKQINFVLFNLLVSLVSFKKQKRP